MSEYQIGSEIQHKDKTWRIVRVITQDVTLFEDESGKCVIIESYVQLKSAVGEIDHIVLDSQRLEYNGSASSIKGLNPLSWRKP